MATENVPLRALRNHTSELLRRVQQGERFRITVQGYPVAELVPLEDTAFVPTERLIQEAAGILHPDDRWADEVRELREQGGKPRDPWDRHGK